MQFNPSPQVVPMAQEFPPSWKKKGESIEIVQGKEKEILTIHDVESAMHKAKKLGINLLRDIPVYYVKEVHATGERDAMYILTNEGEYVLMYPVATDFELRHELIHAIECTQEPTQELLELYEKVKQVIWESSFTDADGEWFNFKKNIHEFLADGYNHPWFISALKKEGLYDEFLAVTSYLGITK